MNNGDPSFQPVPLPQYNRSHYESIYTYLPHFCPWLHLRTACGKVSGPINQTEARLTLDAKDHDDQGSQTQLGPAAAAATDPIVYGKAHTAQRLTAGCPARQPGLDPRRAGLY